jgi:hypothetical protein
MHSLANVPWSDNSKLGEVLSNQDLSKAYQKHSSPLLWLRLIRLRSESPQRQRHGGRTLSIPPAVKDPNRNESSCADAHDCTHIQGLREVQAADAAGVWEDH